MDVLCTIKFKIKSRNSEPGYIKDQWPYPNQDQYAKLKSGTSSIFQSPKQNLKDKDVHCTFKIKIESLNLDHWFTKDQWPYLNQDQDAKSQSVTSSILQSPISRLKGHRCSLHLQNQDREPKFGIYVYQRPVTISKSISGCQTPVRNLQRPPKPQMRT